MVIRSKAPLRLGLAGGGTDLASYADLYGGSVLNTTINMYAHCTIIPTNDNTIVFRAADRGEEVSLPASPFLDLEGGLPLHRGVYNRIVKDYNAGAPLSFVMTSYSDVQPGTGLGSSSTIVVAMIKAFMEWKNLPLGEYDIASLAYQVEREDLKMLGGKQDQYAATFGGFNYIEFYDNNRVIVNPLRLKRWIRNELEASLLLLYTGVSRESANIIKHQMDSTTKNSKSVESMHVLKQESALMKEAILKGDFEEFGRCLARSWKAKKETVDVISNPEIEKLHAFIMENGGRAAKISGAGGGGFMMIYCDPLNSNQLYKKLQKFGLVEKVTFTEVGAQAWTLY